MKGESMGKQEEITTWLKSEIDCGNMTTGDRVPSEYDLAERFGVNKTTANKAVATLVSEGFLERGRRGTGTFVRQRNPFRGQIMLVISIDHPFYTMIVHGAQRAAMNRGYLSTLASPAPDELNEFISRLSPNVAQGILTATYGRLPEPAGVPVIYIDREFSSDVRPRFLINCDSHNGIRMVVREFLKLGHRDLVMLGTYLLRNRIAGFVDELSVAGIAEPEQRIFMTTSGSQVTSRLLDDILCRYPGVTGIVTASDDIAFSLFSAMRKRGLDMPGRISISGFGNVLPICNLLDLTSVEQHPLELGAFAANRLIDILEGQYQESSFNETLPCDLIKRDSIAAPHVVGS